MHPGADPLHVEWWVTLGTGRGRDHSPNLESIGITMKHSEQKLREMKIMGENILNNKMCLPKLHVYDFCSRGVQGGCASPASTKKKRAKNVQKMCQNAKKKKEVKHIPPAVKCVCAKCTGKVRTRHSSCVALWTHVCLHTVSER